MARNRQHRRGRRNPRKFMPQSRMRHIRFEEAVAHSKGKRSGKPYHIAHWTCGCGSVECIGTAVPRETNAAYEAERYASWKKERELDRGNP